ncbi:MAG: prepilin-type N-terminal cleavage/methylation domain-containing protein [Planctomycetota bacterium]|jgi:prepilin-type N-terminal cleavage/methylation domain-containing protein
MYQVRHTTAAKPTKGSGAKRGFTLIEVLVVVAIIALLAAILIPSLARAREQAKIVSCAANCKQLGTMTEVYRAASKSFVPVMFNAAADATPQNDFEKPQPIPPEIPPGPPARLIFFVGGPAPTG